MEPETRYTLVGAIVVLLTAAMLWFIVWLSASGSASEHRFYTIHFERQSLEGLQVGGDVNMRGIKVGRVEDYAIKRENINRVNVTIRVQRRIPVSENTTAQIARNILTGIARIDLYTPGVPGPELIAVPVGENHPVIPEGLSNMEQITESANKLADSADTALSRVNLLLGPANLGAIEQTLHSLREFSAGLPERLTQFDQAVSGMVGVTRSLQQTSEQIGSSMQSLAASYQPLATRTDGVLREAREAVRRYSTLAQSLDAQAKQLGGATEGMLDTSVRELVSTMRELRRAADAIATAARRLEDPRSVIFGPRPQQLGPGETSQ
ncbi:MAG: MlaD family protein [Burkholderiaceae bacterium]